MRVKVGSAGAATGSRVAMLLERESRLPASPGWSRDERSLVRRAMREGLARGARGEVVRLLLPGGAGAGYCTLLGLGPRRKLDPETVRRAFGLLGRSVAQGEPEGPRPRSPVVDLSDPLAGGRLASLGWEAVGRAIAEGYRLGCYSYRECKSERRRSDPPPLVLVPGELDADAVRALRRGVRVGTAVGEGVCLARDLSNRPANRLDPVALATEARRVARSVGLRCRVLGPAAIEKERMGALLAVAAGSDRPPRCIILEHRGGGRGAPTVALVGKAVTFDSGGISLKPSRGMEEMKFDMAGGAAVIGVLRAMAKLRAPLRVVGIIPAVENLPSGRATRPGDVVRSASGKTIEVINTDAEGRLILADALHYARRYDPAAVVDIATLTGAVVVALGETHAGAICPDRDLMRRLRKASETSGERVWELPLSEETRRAVRSRVADLRNAAGRNAGAITAGAFLSSFAEGLAWAHLDIAGTAWTTRARPYEPIGATGAGVRLLADLALGFPKSRG